MPDYDLAGDRMTVHEGEDGVTTYSFDDKGTGRVCGTCTLCCKLLPLPPLRKAAGDKCRHQKAGKGCTIYQTRPMACRTWACRWLADPDTAGMPRPDRCHYVIDSVWDYITMTPHEGGESHKIGVQQVWVDPAFRSAHKAPELRAFIEKVAERWGRATIIRWGSRDAVTVFAPCLSSDREWHEQGGSVEARNDYEADILSMKPRVFLTDGTEKTA
jgi:hypothetical protein